MRRVSWNKLFDFKWNHFCGHASHEACELKLVSAYVFAYVLCHASHEACELKCRRLKTTFSALRSRLAWGVWVEITLVQAKMKPLLSRLAWGVWVEIVSFNCALGGQLSRLAWGVWVEIPFISISTLFSTVTPRMRRVSWNIQSQLCRSCPRIVTPRMRRVSWNFEQWKIDTLAARHASHEACELKLTWSPTECHVPCHASHEACELKCIYFQRVWKCACVTPRMRRVSWNSRPKREIKDKGVTPRMRRVSWNAAIAPSTSAEICHASHEACELKLARSERVSERTSSRLAWGVWVEIEYATKTNEPPIESRLAWGVWVEIGSVRYRSIMSPSRLAWGVWVEIPKKRKPLSARLVTPRMRRVSWNSFDFWNPFRISRSRLAWGVWVEIDRTQISRYALRLCHASHEACELK